MGIPADNMHAGIFLSITLREIVKKNEKDGETTSIKTKENK